MKRTALQLWEDEVDALKSRMPHVCANCHHEGTNGHCLLHDATPPADFAEEPNACADWKDVVPF